MGRESVLATSVTIPKKAGISRMALFYPGDSTCPDAWSSVNNSPLSSFTHYLAPAYACKDTSASSPSCRVPKMSIDLPFVLSLSKGKGFNAFHPWFDKQPRTLCPVIYGTLY